MRYKVLLKTLKVLIYLKRFFWWFSTKTFFVLGWLGRPVWRVFGYIQYKTSYLYKKLSSISGLDDQLVKRDNLQAVIFLVLFFVAIPQTVLYAKKPTMLPGLQTLAYSLMPADQDNSLEEVTATVESDSDYIPPSTWKTGVISSDQFTGLAGEEIDLGTVMAGGSALSKPIIFPGAAITGSRTITVEYVVQAGDSLGGIAARYQVSMNTILWENSLSGSSYLHPGDKLRILPVSGLTHTIKKGDTLKKIAGLYSATVEDIIKFNKLKDDGSDLIIGEKVIVPNGTKVVASAPVTNKGNVTKVVTPSASKQAPTVSGYVWPTGVHLITQYFTWQHHGLDIAGGSMSTPNYAAKAGVVEKSQCGWNSGYGCVIIINHGGGIKTLYGHNSKLLVSAGDQVVTGQTIGLMGNTGNVRGRTGIHLHFEVWVNGVRTNPFQFVK